MVLPRRKALCATIGIQGVLQDYWCGAPFEWSQENIMHLPTRDHAHPWRTVEELIEIGYQRSRVVMMNECHAGWFRCIRTRRIGQRLLPTAHRLGVRHLAMEALYPSVVEKANALRHLPRNAFGYLAQPEMQEFIQSALDLGWTLVAYEADFQQEPAELSTREKRNWREEQQALNLIEALAGLPADGRMLVWCGNNHHSKAIVPIRPGESEDFWGLMGYHFREKSGLDPFVIDQGRTVRFPGMPDRPAQEQWLKEGAPTLLTLGGTAGFLREEAPSCFRSDPDEDAYVVSLDNEMQEWNPLEQPEAGSGLS
jgi:hypothetical protein